MFSPLFAVSSCKLLSYPPVFNILSLASRLSVSPVVLVYMCIRVPGVFLLSAFEDPAIATKTLLTRRVLARWCWIERSDAVLRIATVLHHQRAKDTH